MGLALEPHGFHYKTIPHLRSTSLISFWRVGNLQFKLYILHSYLWIQHHTKGFHSLLTFHLWVVATFTTPNFSPLPSLSTSKITRCGKISTPKPSLFYGHEDVHFHPENPNSPGPISLFSPIHPFSQLWMSVRNKNDTRFPRTNCKGRCTNCTHIFLPHTLPPPPNPPNIIPKNKNKALDREIRQWVLSTLTTCHIGIKGIYKYLNPTWPYYILTLHKSSHALHL
jgi:hypothetical protein